MKRNCIIIITSAMLFFLLPSCVSQQSVAVSKNVLQAFKEISGTTGSAAGTPTPSPTPTFSPTPSPSPSPMPTLVAYNGPVRHIFFHPLIVYPERAFDGDFMEKGYNDWFVTVKEFKLMINSIYKNNYILVDINSLWSINTETGKTVITKNQLMLPEGKKPIVISIDDLNYYQYMLQNGNASKMVLDSEGNTAVLSIQADGSDVVNSDEIVPILDAFVKEHPDFSFNRAKGVIALTGYEGILGYRTNNLESPDYEHEKSETLKVLAHLKETGWSFASHGYGHLNAGKISEERLAGDTKRWKDEVGSLIGDTSIYIYPYGSRVIEKENDPKLKCLMDFGFHIFCAVGPDGIIKYNTDFVTLDRKSVDGMSLHLNSKYLSDLFDCNAIIDSVRPDNY